METMQQNEQGAIKVWNTLTAINCEKFVKEKNGLRYLPWAWAWHTAKSKFPTLTSRIYEDSRGLIYFTDGKTAYVKVSITIEGNEIVEVLAIANYSNRAIPLADLAMTDVVKTIQRALTKAIARHGLGFYLYAGEDLPLDEAQVPVEERRHDATLTYLEGNEKAAAYYCQQCSVEHISSLTKAQVANIYTDLIKYNKIKAIVK